VIDSSQGQLQLTLLDFGVFDTAGQTCRQTAHSRLEYDGCAEGNALVLLDDQGVGKPAVDPATWLAIYPTQTYPATNPTVTWEVDSYEVGGFTVYNFLCAPIDNRPSWVQRL
jgi:hypothetical protein